MATVPSSLQPTGVAQRQPTVTQQRKIRQYGSLENYEKAMAAQRLAKQEAERVKTIEEEIKKSGIQSPKSVEDYKKKYESLSLETKKYIATPQQYQSAVKEIQQKYLKENAPKISDKINYYQDRLKKSEEKYDRRIDRYKDRGDSERVARAKLEQRQYREYYKGVIEGLNEGANIAAPFSEILSYAKDVGAYERDLYTYGKAKRLAKEPQATLKITDTSPDVISYTGQPTVKGTSKVTYEGLLKDYKGTRPSKVTGPSASEDVYVPIEDLQQPAIELIDVTPKGPDTRYVSERPVTGGRGRYSTLSNQIVPPENIETYDYGQGTMITKAPGIPSEAAQFVRRLEREKELKELKAQGEYKESSVFTYDYGQGSPITQTPETFSILKGVGPPTTRPVNAVVEERRIIPRTAEEKERTLERIRTIEEDFAAGQRPPRPLLTEISAAGDTRGFLGTVLNIGPKPELTGSQVTLGTEAVLSEVQQEVYERELRNNMKSVYRQAEEATDLKKFQSRVDAGESYDKVVEEYNQAVKDANKMIAEQREKFDKQYSQTIGKSLESSAQKIFFDTQLIAQQKDQEAKIGGYLGKGAAVGGAAAAVTFGATAAAPVLIPAVAGVGLIAGGLYTGYQYGKAVFEGQQVSRYASAIGFSPIESAQRGLIGGSQSITPFAYTSAGALVGGLIVGGGLRYARKPVVTTERVGVGKAGIRAEGTIAQRATYKSGGVIKPKVVAGQQKISPIVNYGRRTIVTTKFRQFFDMKNLYSGSPRDARGYARAFGLLRQYGYTPQQAEQTLRFVRPTYRELFLVSSTSTKAGKGISVTTQKTREIFRRVPVEGEPGVFSRTGPTTVRVSKITTQEIPASQVAKAASRVYGKPFVYGKDATGFRQLIETRAQKSFTGVGRKATITEPTQQIFGLSERTYDATGLYTRVRSVPLYGTSSAGDRLIVYGQPFQSSSYVFDADITSGPFSIVPGTSTTPPIVYSGPTSGTGDVFTITGAATSGPSSTARGSRTLQLRQAATRTEPSTSQSTIQLSRYTTELMTAPATQQVTILSTPKPIVQQPASGYSALLLSTTAASFAAGTAFATSQPAQEIQPRQLDRFIIGQGVNVRQIQDQSSELERPPVILDTGDDTITDTVIEEPPPEPPPIGDPINFIVKPQFLPERERGANNKPVPLYQGYVMVGNRYKKVDEPPAPKSKALDIITNIIDNTVSAQGKLVPTGKKRVPTAKDRSDDYYNRNKRKFREFKIVNGKSVKLKNKVIERRGYRSDTPGEKAGLTVAQNMARRAKRAAGVPTRKSTKKRIPFRL